MSAEMKYLMAYFPLMLLSVCFCLSVPEVLLTRTKRDVMCIPSIPINGVTVFHNCQNAKCQCLSQMVSNFNSFTEWDTLSKTLNHFQG